MGLRENSIRIIGITLIFLVIALFVITQFFVMNNIIDLEDQNMQNNVGRALNALNNEMNALSDFAHDWSSWDDTYAFIQDNNSEYITSNLMDETFVNSKINIIVYVDSSGKIVYEKAFDLENEKEVPVPKELNSYIKNGSLLNKNIKGLIMVNKTPMMAVSRPILTSTDDGTPKGTLIMGRYLNQAEIQILSNLTRLPISITNINDSNANKNLNNAISSLNESGFIYITALGEDIVQGSSNLKDVNGKPILTMRIDLPREYFKQGQNSLIYFFASIFVAELIFGIVIIAYLDKSVLLRLTNLNTKVKRIGNESLSSRVPVKGNDELSGLAESINNMLAALEKSQHELKISEKGYRMLAEAAQDMIFILDHNKRFIYANSWTLEQLGHPITGENVDILFKSEISNKLEHNIEKTFNEGNSYYVENKMKSGNKEKWFYTSLIPLKDSNDNINAILGISRDITNLKHTELELRKYHNHLEKMVEERTKELRDTTKQLENEVTEHKKAENTLRKIEAQLRIAMDMAKLASWEYDVESDMFTFDDHFYALYGTTAEKEGGTLMSSEEYAQKFIPPEEALLVSEEIGKALEIDDPDFTENIEHSIIKANGDKGFINVRFGVIKDENGKTIKTYGANQDITERKKAEEEIKKLNENLRHRTRELENINKELESFSYSVSHDLRAPLRSIDGFSQALLEDYQDALDSQGKDYLDRVRKASQRMAQLIDDLLNLSRVTRSQMRYKDVNLSEIVRKVAKNLQQMEPGRNVNIDIADNIIVGGDEKLLRVAIENLMNNAWKFTSKHSDAKIEFGVLERNDVHICFLRDNGAGFDMEYAHKLFNPFQRLHDMKEYPGSGIGLATVQRIIHRHNGRIWAKGEINKGATFYFTFGYENDT